MRLYMAWGVTPIAEAGQEMPDMESAIGALDVSVRRIRAYVRATEGLETHAARMAARMRSEGHRALSEGRSWSGTEGPLHMQLTPR